MTFKRFSDWVRGEAELFDVRRFRLGKDRPEVKVPGRGFAIALDRRKLNILNALTVLLLLAFFLLIVCELPVFGAEGITDNEVAARYIEQGVYEVGAMNAVTNMILVYRGFDTFGEATVLFAATACVIMLLKKDRNNSTAEDEQEDRRFLESAPPAVLTQVAKRLLPFILVFGVYILLNGHLSPGGGFSGGAVLGAALILTDVALGRDRVHAFLPPKVFDAARVGALCVYGLIKFAVVILGANGHDESALAGVPGRILSAGFILPINIMVGIVVACVVYGFYAYFSRGELA